MPSSATYAIDATNAATNDLSQSEAIAPVPVANPAQVAATRYVLHVGCGMPRAERFPAYFRQAQWTEIRLDIDPEVEPHVIASMTDMAPIPSGSMDAIWSSHNLEHLNAFEVPVALAEFKRVLKQDGFAVITLPDLRAIARHILSENLDKMLYQSAAGPITPLDMMFGHQASLARGNHYMAHRTGFTATTLGQCLLDAGFAEVRVHEGQRWDLWAIAAMADTAVAVYDDLAKVMQ